MKIRPVRAQLLRADGRTDRQTDGRTDGCRDMKKLKVTFRSYANDPKTEMYWHTKQTKAKTRNCKRLKIGTRVNANVGCERQSISNALGAAHSRTLHPILSITAKGNNFLTRFPVVGLGQAFSLSRGFADSSKWPKVTPCWTVQIFIHGTVSI
jgi:hypothetical protein